MDFKKFRKRNCPFSDDLILQEIMPKLPTKSVMRFKSVSKTWLSLISQHSSLIAAKHTGENPVTIISGRYRTDVDTISKLFFLCPKESTLVEIDTSYVYKKNPHIVELIGSSNGVLCLELVYSDKTHDLVLWNPVTKEFSYLPRREVDPDEGWLTGYALGFDAHSGDYKVLWLEDWSNSVQDFVKGKIFSKKDGRWRNLKSFARNRSTTIFLAGYDGLTVDGTMYWTVHPCNLLSFDLSKEEFREFDGPLPALTDPSKMDVNEYEFVDWKGSLGFVFITEEDKIHVWLKNKDSDNSDNGWQKISTIQPSLGPIAFEKITRGHVILIYCGDYSDTRKQIFYDLIKQEQRELEQACLPKLRWRQICDHFCTLISPN